MEKTVEGLLGKLDEKVGSILASIDRVEKEVKEIDKKLDTTIKDTTRNESEIRHIREDFREFQTTYKEQKDRIWQELRSSKEEIKRDVIKDIKLLLWTIGSAVAVTLVKLLFFN